MEEKKIEDFIKENKWIKATQLEETLGLGKRAIRNVLSGKKFPKKDRDNFIKFFESLGNNLK